MFNSNFAWTIRLLATSLLSAAIVFPLVFAQSSQEHEQPEYNQAKNTQKIPLNQNVKTLTLPVSSPKADLPNSANLPGLPNLPPAPDYEKIDQEETFHSEPAKPVADTTKSKSQPPKQPPFDINKSIKVFSALFDSPVSWGMVAIGLAEGNYRLFEENGSLFVQQTSFYYGHTDPGNLSWGQRVTNYGPCSDQGRSKGDIALAERICSQRALEKLPTHLFDLNAAGINPNYDVEALVNTADLYNQASPIHSRRFPEALLIAYQGGKKGVEAMAWARTASFYLNDRKQLDLERGRNKASGLLGICRRERSARTEWECVYRDQLRRANAVNQVLKYYYQAQKSQS